MKIGDDLGLSAAAVALRPVRLVDGVLRTYTAMTGVDDPHTFCYVYLNRLRAFGHLYTSDDPAEYALIDVLDADSSIIGEYAVDRQGFDYLRRHLRFAWENREECLA